MTEHGMRVTYDPKTRTAYASCPCGWESKRYKINHRYPENHMRFATNAGADHYKQNK